VTNRLEAIVMTRQLASGWRSTWRAGVTAFGTNCELLARSYQIEAAVKAYRPVSGGRRIAFVSPTAA